MEAFFKQKKTLIIEAAVVIVFLVGMYYLYTVFSEDTASVTTVQTNEQLLGKNLIEFLKATSQERLSFDTKGIMAEPLVQQLRDFTETISMTETRGRLDPFVPYAATRPLR